MQTALNEMVDRARRLFFVSFVVCLFAALLVLGLSEFRPLVADPMSVLRLVSFFFFFV